MNARILMRIVTAITLTLGNIQLVTARPASIFSDNFIHDLMSTPSDMVLKLPAYMPFNLYPVLQIHTENPELIHDLDVLLGGIPNCEATACNMGHIWISRNMHKDGQLERFNLIPGQPAYYSYINARSAGHRHVVMWKQNGWFYTVELREIVATKAQVIKIAASMATEHPIKRVPYGED